MKHDPSEYKESVAIPERAHTASPDTHDNYQHNHAHGQSIDSIMESHHTHHAGLGATSIIAISVVSTLVVSGIILGIVQYQYGHLLSAAGGLDDTAVTESVAPMASVSETDIVQAVAAANPAVVSIIVTQDVPVYEEYFETYDPFGGMFGPGNEFRIPRRRESGTEEREVGGGSGFFVSSDGLVVTNRHVVALESARYSVVTTSGATYPVEVVARDPLLDIAILQVTVNEEESAPVFPYLAMADSSTLQLGQTVIAIGNALGEFQNSVSVGVVSGLSRSIMAGDRRGMSELLEEVIQTDAAINPGNSGGPLLNSQGEVIGVNVAVALGSDNIGFALPVNVVKSIVESIEEYGEIRLPFLGVRYVMLDPRIAEEEGLSVTYGAYISSGEDNVSAVQPDTPAARAGIEEGDVIIEIGGISLEERSLANAIRTFAPGEDIEIVVSRDGEEVRLSATLSEFSG